MAQGCCVQNFSFPALSSAEIWPDIRTYVRTEPWPHIWPHVYPKPPKAAFGRFRRSGVGITKHTKKITNPNPPNFLDFLIQSRFNLWFLKKLSSVSEQDFFCWKKDPIFLPPKSGVSSGRKRTAVDSLQDLLKITESYIAVYRTNSRRYPLLQK